MSERSLGLAFTYPQNGERRPRGRLFTAVQASVEIGRGKGTIQDIMI